MSRCIVRNKLLLMLLFSFNITFAQSPGNVSSGLYLWLKANSGVATTGNEVTSWANQASTPMTTQASKTASSSVTLDASAFNYNPTLVFDGALSQRLVGTFSIAATNPALLFAVVKKNGADGSFLLNPYSLGPGGGAGITWSNNRYTIDGGGYVCSSTATAANIPAVVRADYASTTLGDNAFTALNGTTSSPCGVGVGPVSVPSVDFEVGGRTFDFGWFTDRIYNGQLAEVIHYDSDILTATEVNKIESYLAIKYGTTLSTNYLNAAASTIYDVSAYNKQIIGLSRDDNSGQLQKQSHHDDDSSRIYLSTLASSNALNSGSFSSDNQHLLMGHNNGKLNSNGSTEYPSGLGIYSRIDREWKVTNTNFDGTFSIDVKINSTPIDQSHLRVLIDLDGDFTNATLISPTIAFSNSVTTISGLSVSEFPANSTRYFTIVSMNSVTPLPIELLHFNATAESDGAIKLEWQTATEINNSYFTIERSVNAHEWEALKIIKGAGNSIFLLNYSTIDESPYKGISYYRLKQTDFDGHFSYSQIRSVHTKHLSGIKLKVYPNPTKHSITVTANKSTLQLLEIFNMYGQNLTMLCEKTNVDQSNLVIDLSELSAGLYYLKTKTTVTKVCKQ